MTSKKEDPKIPEQNPERIEIRPIAEEMKSSYIDYAMSVIVGRALPDVRDGLKPVHRRILYTMDEMGLSYNRAHKKSARVVGDVLGKYHPHGDASVYDSLVRMAQNFSMREPLVDGQGNWGSIDGDPPAAMRYTEVRLARISSEMLADIEKNTVDFIPNYDGSLMEPSVLPAKFPNLLVNGSSGIAVGMATNIPPHNLQEACEAAKVLLKNPDATIDELIEVIKGPDLPTGGLIMGSAGIKEYMSTGKGSFTIRAKTEFEELHNGRKAIVVKDIPYQVNKAAMLEAIAALVREKKLTDISDLRDESDREGIRVVIEIKKEGNPHVVLNQLFRHTQLETSFGVIMLALVDGRPKILNIKELLNAYLEHRRDVIVRRTKFELAKAEERAHIVEGLRLAVDQINKIIKIIRESKDVEEAKKELMEQVGLSSLQAQAILDMRLAQITGLERKKLEEEYKQLTQAIERLRFILSSSKAVAGLIEEELTEVQKTYGTPRLTEIVHAASEVNIEDLIKKQEVVVTISNQGYIKRMPVDVYRVQSRGGKGITAADTKEGEDFIEQVFVTDTHATMLFFTNKGRAYKARVFEVPESSRMARGKPLIQFIGVSNKEEKVTGVVSIRDFASKKPSFLFMATRQGCAKRCEAKHFENLRKTGVAAINLREGDVLVGVAATDGKCEAIMATKNGKSIRFAETGVRVMGRVAAGVRGIRLEKDDEVIGLEIAYEKDQRTLLTVCENGYGKRTDLAEYRDQSRGGAGVLTIKATERNGAVVGIKLISDDEDLMVLTEKGMAVRLRAKDIKVISRNTQGVRLVRLEEGDKVSCVAPIAANGDAANNAA